MVDRRNPCDEQDCPEGQIRDVEGNCIPDPSLSGGGGNNNNNSEIPPPDVPVPAIPNVFPRFNLYEEEDPADSSGHRNAGAFKKTIIIDSHLFPVGHKVRSDDLGINSMLESSYYNRRVNYRETPREDRTESPTYGFLRSGDGYIPHSFNGRRLIAPSSRTDYMSTKTFVSTSIGSYDSMGHYDSFRIAGAFGYRLENGIIPLEGATWSTEHRSSASYDNQIRKRTISKSIDATVGRLASSNLRWAIPFRVTLGNVDGWAQAAMATFTNERTGAGRYGERDTHSDNDFADPDRREYSIPKERWSRMHVEEHDFWRTRINIDLSGFAFFGRKANDMYRTFHCTIMPSQRSPDYWDINDVSMKRARWDQLRLLYLFGEKGFESTNWYNDWFTTQNNQRPLPAIWGHNSVNYQQLWNAQSDLFKKAHKTGIIPDNRFYSDVVFESPLPMYEKESDGTVLSNAITAHIEVEVQNDDPDRATNWVNSTPSFKTERKPSLYRVYNNIKEMTDLDFTQPDREGGFEDRDPDESVLSTIFDTVCDFDDNIQKFTCENILDLNQANESGLLQTFDRYVNIRIGTSQESKLADLLHETRMDKHIMEYMTKYDPEMRPVTQATFDTSDPNPPMYNLRTVRAFEQAGAAVPGLDNIDNIESGEEIDSINRSFFVGNSYTTTSLRAWPKKIKHDFYHRTYHKMQGNVDVRTPEVRQAEALGITVPTWPWEPIDYIKSIKNFEIDEFEDKHDYVGPMPLGHEETEISVQNYSGFCKRHYPLGYEGMNTSNLLRFWDLIRSQVFINKFKKLYLPSADGENQGKVRSFADILESAPAHSEVIGYKICKYLQDPENPDALTDPVQEIYLMDSSEIQDINFYDTQVLFGKTYIYRIFALNFVIGSMYKYHRLYIPPNSRRDGAVHGGINAGAVEGTVQNIPSDAGICMHRKIDIGLENPNRDNATFAGKNIDASFDVLCFPFYNIVESPFFERTVTIKDKPPIFPQVSVLPEYGNSTGVRFLLQPNHGTYSARPIQVLDTEEETEMLDQMRRSAAARNPGPDDFETMEIEYRNDSAPTKYQMIRLDKPAGVREARYNWPPSSYEDFKYSRHIKEVNVEFGTTAIIEDGFSGSEFQANTEYYYIFRAIDAAGISNPTEVYKVKLVDYENGIFMKTSTHELEPAIDSRPVEFTRLIKVMPRALHGKLNTEARATAPGINDVSIGASEEELNRHSTTSPWDNKFKMTIKSKTSGRRIEVYFKFVQGNTIVQLSEEQVSEDPGSVRRSSLVDTPCGERTQIEAAVRARDAGPGRPGQANDGSGY